MTEHSSGKVNIQDSIGSARSRSNSHIEKMHSGIKMGSSFQ
jgi:hypothetical protein